jgi:hypothetical protein
MESAMCKRRQAPSALEAFIARKAEIDAILARLAELSDEHFNLHPDEIHWGHVGSLEYFASLLRRVSDAAFKEGEHAD